MSPHHLHHLTTHEYYPGSFTWELWQIISLIVGLLLLCFLIGICINCFRTVGYGMSPVMPLGGVYV